MIFWDVRTRLQGSKRSRYVDGVSGLSGVASYVNEVNGMYVRKVM
jgi:hypothetical protein